MNHLYKYIKPMLIFISSIIIIPILLTIFNLFKLRTNKVIVIIFGSILMLILGFLTGKKSQSKGYLSGLLLSVICIFILLILSLLFNSKININSFIYYIILIISSILGSMIGINKKKK